MRSECHLIRWVQDNCPNIWSVLGQKARTRLPSGLVQYLSAENAVTAKEWLRHADKRMGDLAGKCRDKAVGDAYRRDLSAVENEQKLAELLCEMTACAALAKFATAVCLRPRIEGQRTKPDGRFDLAAHSVFVEVKRYEDPGPTPRGRSIARSAAGTLKPDTARPRMMDLIDKLRDVPSQFAEDTLNVLFVFHQSIGNSHGYLQQALFGDAEFSTDPNSVSVTSNDAPFAREEWKRVSAVGLVRVCQDGKLECPLLWENPQASNPLPKVVRDLISTIR